MKEYNVPLVGNVTVEADSVAHAIMKVRDALAYVPEEANSLAIDILASLDIDNTGVSEL